MYIKITQETLARRSSLNRSHIGIYSIICYLNTYLFFKFYRLSPWWKKWIFFNGFKASDSISIWWSVFDIWSQTSNNKLLEFLSCSVSPYIVRNYLPIIANTSNCNFNANCKDVNIPINERINNFLLIVAKHADNSVILQYILNNYDKLKPR